MWNWITALRNEMTALLFGVEKKPTLGNWKEKASYAIGVDLARSIKREGMEIKAEELARGVRDELSGAKLLMTERDLRATFSAFKAERNRKRPFDRTNPAENYRNAERAYTAGTRGMVDVMTLPSGMQLKAYREDDAGKPVRRSYAAGTPSSL